jgi:N-methylhydantoinase A
VVHHARTGFTLDREVEIVSARHVASSAGMAPTFARRGARVERAGGTSSRAALVDDGGACDAVVRGPVTIVLPDATLRVADGWTARALDVGGWLVERT